MDFLITSAKIVGNPDQSGWSQVHDFKPEDPLKLKTRGRLLAVISISSEDRVVGGGINQVWLGREILTRMHEEYFGNLEPSAYESLQNSLEAVNKEFSDQEKLVEISAASVLEDVIYLATMNGGRIYILREGNLIPVLVSERQEVKSASGWIRTKDTFLLGSSLFFKAFPEGVIKGNLESGSPHSFAEALIPTIHSKENFGSLGALVFRIETNFKKSVAYEIPNQEGSQKKGIGIRLSLLNLVDKILESLPEKRIIVRSETIDFESKKRKKAAPLVGMILILILVTSIIFGLRQRRIKLFRKEYQRILLEAQHEFDEAKSLAELDTSRARELALSAKTKADSLKERGVKDNELVALIEDINKSMGSIAGIYEGKPEVFLDLSLISSGFKGDILRMSEEKMTVLDSNAKKLVGIDISTKKTEGISRLDYLPDAIDTTSYGRRHFILSSDGVREVGDEVELVIKPDWDPKRVLAAAFAGNFYILEKDKDVIWRYPAIKLGFAEKNNWFGPGIKPDLSDAISWSIDGSIWVLTSEGKVMRFSLGSSQKFSLDIPEQLEFKASGIFTNEDSKYLYFLDDANGKIVIFDKDGNYKGEYISDFLKNSNYMVVSEKERKIVFLSQGKLYVVEAKHLE